MGEILKNSRQLPDKIDDRCSDVCLLVSADCVSDRLEFVVVGSISNRAVRLTANVYSSGRDFKKSLVSASKDFWRVEIGRRQTQEVSYSEKNLVRDNFFL